MEKFIIKYQIEKNGSLWDCRWYVHGKKYISIRRALQAIENMRKDERKHNDGYRFVFCIFHHY